MKLIKWLSKAWPFIIVTFFGTLHYNVIKFVPNDNIEFTNNVIASFTQVAGGLIVLSTINSNLGLFRQISLFSIFQNWVKSFPYFRKIEMITGSARCEMPCFTMSAEGNTSKPCNTLEEKIEEAQRQIKELRDLLYRKEHELLSRISQIDNNLKSEIYKRAP
ncbi:hypothetical protein [Desulfofustis limnaeus]|uniref:Uncharacterized protein n=1 Tax=Desulfofustis limnaeus TaxID=2740163 RepID=A0ABN6M5V0_9BACT|nr:hypothetical protein [Desulfofustis limnaeus]BDD88190.1 hypothetical protein DPPLL_25550 [Desulfofustis limnaeus]